MRMNCAEGFEKCIASLFEYEQLEQDQSVIFGLDEAFTITYFNPQWTEFAQENAGQPDIELSWGIGRRYFEAIPAVLHDFFTQLFSAARESGESLHPATHEYECSSSGTYRKFAMQIYALPNKSGYIVINSLLKEIPYKDFAGISSGHDIDMYKNSDGIISQCCHCRKVKTPGNVTRWDWVPELVRKSSPDTSHTICPICFSYYHRE